MKTIKTTKIKEYDENGKLIKETEITETEENTQIYIPYEPSIPSNPFWKPEITC